MLLCFIGAAGGTVALYAISKLFEVFWDDIVQICGGYNCYFRPSWNNDVVNISCRRF
jgi:hypothetical protein